MAAKKSTAIKPYDFSKLTKSSDEIGAVIFRKLSNPLTKFLIIYTDVTPNQVSFASFIFALAAAFFFASGSYQNQLIGAGFLFIYACLDHVDGGIARIKNMGSKKGKWLDGITGFIIIPMIIFSIAYGIGTHIALTLGSLAMMAYPMQYLIMHFYKLDVIGINEPMKISSSGKFDFLKKIYGSMFFHWSAIILSLANMHILLLWFFATAGNLVWMFTIFLQYKSLRGM